MKLFGHVGLTLAVAYTADWLVNKRLGRGQPRRNVRELGAGLPFSEGWNECSTVASHLLDYRLVAAGSLLPDVIDKPLGLWLAPELVNHTTQSVAHTALFALSFLTVSLVVLYLRHFPGLLVLAASGALHLVFDQMWKQLVTFLWPTMGWSFSPGSAHFLEYSRMHAGALLSFYTDSFELAGAIVLSVFAIRIWRCKGISRFLLSGRLP